MSTSIILFVIQAWLRIDRVYRGIRSNKVKNTSWVYQATEDRQQTYNTSNSIDFHLKREWIVYISRIFIHFDGKCTSKFWNSDGVPVI